MNKEIPYGNLVGVLMVIIAIQAIGISAWYDSMSFSLVSIIISLAFMLMFGMGVGSIIHVKMEGD